MSASPPWSDPLRTAAERLDADTLATLLIATPETGRRAQAAGLRERIDAILQATDRSQLTAAHHHTAQIVWFGTGLARDLRWSTYRFGGFGPHPRLAELLAARPRNVMTAIARSLLVHDAHVYWPVVRQLVEDGRFPRPEADEYLAGMVRNLGSLSWERSREITLVDALLEQFADPRIVAELWQAFELEVVVDQMANAGWQEALVTAVQRGSVDRDRMLDTAIDGQLRDFRPSTAAFFRRVAEGLDPTDDELAARHERLVRIIAGAHPAEQRAAARALRRLRSAGRPVDGTAVAAAVATPLTGRQKAAAMEALRLLDAVDVDVATLGRAAVVGLGHPHADVQAGALGLLERAAATAPLPTDVQEELLLWLRDVAPEHRARLEALTGIEDPAGAAVASTADVEALAGRIHVLPAATIAELSLEDALERARAGVLPAPAGFPADVVPILAPTVLPIADGDELAELLTLLLVGTGDAIDLERAVDGLARTPPATLSRSARSGLARLTDDTPTEAAAGELQLSLAQAVTHWLGGRAPAPPGYLRENRSFLGTPALRHDLAPSREVGPNEAWNTAFDGHHAPAGLLGFVSARLHEAVLVGTSRPRPTLALPERSDGTITAATLAARLAAFPKREAPGRFEAVQALLRVPEGDRATATVAPTRSASAVADALRALGGEDARVTDEGLARAVTTPTVAPTPLRHVRVPHRFGHLGAVGVVRLDVDAPSPRRRDDPAGLLQHQLRVPDRPVDATGWWNPHASVIPPTDRLLARTVALLLPRHGHLVELAVASSLAETLDDDRSTDALDHVVAGLADPDVPLGWSGHLLLAVALSARNEAVGAAASDVVAGAGTDGRLDAALVGRTLAELGAVGVAKPKRFAARLGSLTDDTLLLAEQVRRVLQAWLAALDELPRDAHAALTVLERACERSGAGIDDRRARALLTAGATGTSKRARAAARLVGLPTTGGTAAAADLLEGQVRRGERWSTGG